MVLSLSDVTKAFVGAEGPVPVLRGVDLVLGASETVALTGESGSGKSTLLHIAGGLEHADSGVVTVIGQDVTKLDDTRRADLRRHSIGIVFQQFNLIPSLTVAANVAFQARLAGKEEPDRTQHLIETLGLAPLAQAYPETLSGGQQQRVAIARALAGRPKLLLADEPTGNLDEDTANSVIGEMLGLVAEAGTALLMVTHSKALAARLDRQIHLSQGQLA